MAGITWRFVGDSQGWLYSIKVPPDEQEDHVDMPIWSADLNLRPSFEVNISIILYFVQSTTQVLVCSQISSISTSGSRVMYVYSSILPNSNIQNLLKSHFPWPRENFRTRFKSTRVRHLEPCRNLESEQTDSSIDQTNISAKFASRIRYKGFPPPKPNACPW